MSYYRPGGIGTGSATNVPFQISQGGTGANTAAGARTNLGLGDLATQNKNAVNITGGTVAGITDLAVEDGGTGASNAAQARTNLGLATVANTGSYNDLTDKPSIPDELGDLLDVSLGSATLSVNDVLLYNGSAWVNDTIVLTTADITNAFGDTVLLSADIGVTIQAYDPNILVSGDIGVLVQGYDPEILVSGDIGVTIQPYDATILNASAIGSTVQAYDSNLTSFVGTFTLPTTDGTTNQVLKTDGAGNIGFASAAAAGVSSFNTRTGAITLTSGDVTTALGYTPLGSADIGVSVQAYDADTTKNDVSNTFTTNQIISANSSSDALRITQTGAGNALVVEDSTNPDSTPFVVDASGNVISGYTAKISDLPNFVPKVQIVGTNVDLSSAGLFNYSTSTNGSFLSFAKSKNATTGSQTVVANNDNLMTIRSYGSDGTGFIQATQIRAEVDGTPGTNDMPGRLVFSTTASGASSPTERMRIDSAGNVAIGSATQTAQNFRLAKSITGATTAYGIVNQSAVASGVTSTAVLNYSGLSTQAASFTLGTAKHFSANQDSLGAGSAVTNQFGYVAEASLTGATNNYGFYSNIASGTGRWNFYAAGTATNFFGGDTILGGKLGLGTAGSPSYGTSGQVLTSNGSGSAPTWQTSTTGVSTGKSIALSLIFGF